MDATTSTSINSSIFYFNKMDIPVINDSHSLSFVFVDGETVVQHIANSHDDFEIVSALTAAATNFSKMNDGLDSAIVHRKQTMIYYIMSLSLAFRLDVDVFDVLHTTIPLPAPVTAPVMAAVEAPTMVPVVAPVMAPAMAPVSSDSGKGNMQKSVAVTTKERIRRPRNQFIIYRQQMSQQLHDENPGLTAAAISSIVSKTWKAESPQVKAHFKALADEEDRMHKLNHPGYRYQARRSRVERRKIASTIKALSQYPVHAMSSMTTTDLDSVVMSLSNSNI
ncbi:high mobility group box-domain-containing protein [Apiosordaria backusii]|uniref:High mobility group box-domain-containing protein n=1 Tax=Apiosordaria backusii TaxID=314023 RepID=A0AA40AXF5_9PEZI|nr:high mobility group box-domain-containing protein [Apiosordaria backusii]